LFNNSLSRCTFYSLHRINKCPVKVVSSAEQKLSEIDAVRRTKGAHFGTETGRARFSVSEAEAFRDKPGSVSPRGRVGRVRWAMWLGTCQTGDVGRSGRDYRPSWAIMARPMNSGIWGTTALLRALVLSITPLPNETRKKAIPAPGTANPYLHGSKPRMSIVRCNGPIIKIAERRSTSARRQAGCGST
jgi:hypothetical protein